MSNSEYKHIIWDWNGTLFDDAWLCVEIINQILRKRKLPSITPALYEKTFGFPLIDYYQKLGLDFSIEPFSSVSTEFILEYERRRTQCGLRAGALHTLRSNLQRGVTQSILSASKQDYLEEAVDQFSIRSLFIAIHGLDNHHALGKVEIGKKWASEINRDLRDMILIGDTVHDYEVAQAIGIDCQLIYSGHQDRERLESCGVSVVESFSELYH